MEPITLEECKLMKDSKYRVYVNAVDKALKSFEYTSEWADLIAALGKLNKVIVSNTKFPVIPRRIKISKRLAQCMHPVLPFGVHLKALETYDLIFKSMGTDRLSHELFIYSAGLFPLFGHCAMKVRPDLLTIYETHFVPLGHRLRPALPGFLSGVLPGYEESSDYFERTNKLLTTVCEEVGPSHFYGCIWDCIASNSSVRLPATFFILSHFDKRLPTEDQAQIMGNNIETMVCGLIACVQDQSVLVQRCALDLLILGFPMHNSHLTTEDMIRLVTAALSTILRRDISLNRRLYGWLMGSDVNMVILSHHPSMKKAKAEQKSTSYFDVFSREMLIKALKIILDEAIGVQPFDLKPYKLLTSLIDKDGIGLVILDDILFEYFRLLYLSCNAVAKSDTTELLSCANLLFGALEQKYLWSHIGVLFSNACKVPSCTFDMENPVKRVGSGDLGIVETCTLTEFLLDKVSSFETSTDTPSKHLPSLFLQVTALLMENCSRLSAVQVAKGLKLSAKILTRVQPIIVGHHNISQVDTSDTEPSESSSFPIGTARQGSTTSSCTGTDRADTPNDENELPRDESPTSSSSSFSLLEQCLRQYEKFFVSFIYETRKRVGETRQVQSLLDALKTKENDEKTKEIESLLQTMAMKRTPDPELGNEWVEPMKVASRLLVDLSTLQTFFQTPNSHLETEVFSNECNSSIESLPEWLRVLITCTCWLNSCVSLQIVAITALLDLVSLCSTAQSLVSSSLSSVEGSTLLILPLLTPSHLNYIEKHTYIFQVISHWLWNQLSDPKHRVRCVELLHQLHSVTPHNDIVEASLGHYLKPSTNQISRLESFRKFTLLWHVGREVNARLGNSLRVSDIFFKSMLKMLDNLKLCGSDCLKVESQEWLLHSLLRGDIHRILDPLFYMLLDPSTARLSVLHIKFNSRGDGVEQTHRIGSKDVYAVSSVDGNVVYHIDSKKESKHKGDKFNSYVTAVPISSGSKNVYVTEKKESDPTEDPISLYVNPFSGEGHVNTDFDELYDESEPDKVEVKNETGPNLVTRNRSYPSLEKDLTSSKFGINEALKISSLDLIALSDTIFTRVSDGETPLNRMKRGSFSTDGIASLVSLDSYEIVRSWSFPSKDHEQSSAELEESAAADEYFSSVKPVDGQRVIEEVVSDLLDQVTQLSADTVPKNKKLQNKKTRYESTISTPNAGIDTLHSFMLLYHKKYDHDTVLYSLEALRNILITNPRAFLCAASTTGLVTRSPILKLLARHRKSLFGRGFSSDLESGTIRSAMYLEVIMSTCLYFMRSYYPNIENLNLSQRDIIGNKEVQMSSTEVLSLLCGELVHIVRESNRSLACYLADLISRTKLYKILLHSIHSGLVSQLKYNVGQFTHQVLAFNEGFDLTKDRMSRHAETLQKQQIKLLLSLIILEYEIHRQKGDSPVPNDKPVDAELKYINGKFIPQQPLFIAALSRGLDIHPLFRNTHSHWTALIACSLSYLGSALNKVVTTALKQMCHNIEVLSECYVYPTAASFPPDYAIVHLEALTIISHYCLLDTSTAFNQHTFNAGGPNSSRIFDLFMPNPLQTEQKKDKTESQLVARKSVLGHLPRVIASTSVLWHALVNRKEREGENSEVGSPRVVKQQILDFLSPIAVHHGTSFLAAMAVVWRERRPSNPHPTISVMPNASDEQKVLVQLLTGIKAMPIDTLVQTLHQVVKHSTLSQDLAVGVEVSALELFVHYTQLVPGTSLFDSWPSLLLLFKEAPTLSPPAQFLLLGALSQFVHKCPPFSDKKDLRDLQDITVKMVESCTTIAGACLEQTTWLRRNLAVREEEPVITPDKEDKYVDDVESTEIDWVNDGSQLSSDGKSKKASKSKLKRVTKKIRQDAEKLQIRAMNQWFMRAFVNEANLPLDVSEKYKSNGIPMAQYSIGALTVLGQILAPLLDVAFGSQEKERVVNILINLMYHVTPYLKNHTQRNASSYFACSQLLASLSSYQYTRKAWKKDVMELMFDSSFFQMEIRSLKCFCTVVDNLISQENSTFREFMSRVAMPQSNSLNIFSSKDQEYEQRGQLLKRLAYVIYCGENDQFQNNMPEIQERLAESVKLPQMVPSLQAQVFLCFRVLLLRMSPTHIIPLWPTIISEILQVMILIEQDLSSDYENFSSTVRALSSADWNWNGNAVNFSLLQLQLATANLLFLAVQLPADRLPQFQMYRWAFVGAESGHKNSSEVDFVPHLSRVAELMDKKFGALEAVPTPLLPLSHQIRSLQDLHPFFTAMRTGKYTPLTVSQLEHSLELDFLDAMAPR